MRERGATRPFEGKFESWTYAPICDTGVVASAIRRALHLETKSYISDHQAVHVCRLRRTVRALTSCKPS